MQEGEIENKCEKVEEDNISDVCEVIDTVNVAEQQLEPAALSTNDAPFLEATNQSNLDESICEKDIDSDVPDDENDDETKENYEGFNGTGRTVTLQMLMGANVLQPGKSVMTIEYLGQKFVGDLLQDGKIKSQETETIFLTPSAWAMHCKRIINPEKKSGCGWASVKYKGKKLDAYKNSWLRKCAMQKESTPEGFEPDGDKKSDSPLPVVKRNVFQHNVIANRNIMHDANMLIEAVSFTAIGKLQPFLITISSSALLLTDFHCHLSTHEVCGYFGGNWDVNSHTLSIIKCYPCRNSRFDRHKAADVEREIQKSMMRDQLILVGWYHSHPKFQAEPTLRDCDAQLDFQIRMHGPNEMSYTPCVSLIVSPYYDDNPTLESVIKSIWVVPPCENKQSLEYGRPMLMQYSVLSNNEIPEEVRTDIQSCVDYYSQFRNEIVKFNSVFMDDITYIEKLKNTLYSKFPSNQNDKALWNWICTVLGCEQEDDFIPPKTIKIMDDKEDTKLAPIPQQTIPSDIRLNEIKDETAVIKTLSPEDISLKFDEQNQSDKTGNELKIMSLQEQLCMPSGLNMNPIRMISPLATPNPAGISTTTTIPTIPPPVIPPPTAVTPTVDLLPPLPPLPPTNSINITQSNPIISSTISCSASPRDSPITISSNAASPAKFEVPVRASPSPAKSDTSSHTSRTRNSPAPSPGKFSISDIARNSPSITPNKYEPPTTLVPTPASCLSSANDLMAASIAQLAGQLPPNFLQTDIATLFQQQRKEYSNSSLNQLAATAAKVGNQKRTQSPQSGTGGDITDPNVAAAVAAYSNSFNMPRAQDAMSQGQMGSTGGKSKSERSSKSSLVSSINASANSYKTKLMKELDDLKNDPLKMSELMRSPEYAALLLQQAEALGATTLGTLGFGAEFNYLTGGLGMAGGNNSGGSNSSSKSSKASAALLNNDYGSLIQASKLLGYDSYIQQAKNNDLNAFLQQHMGAAAAAAAAAVSGVPSSVSPSNSKKQQQSAASQSHPDYTTLLQTYSKLLDPNNQFGVTISGSKSHAASANHELSALLAGVGGMSSGGSSSSSSKQKQKELQAQMHQQQQQQQHQTDMLNQLLQSEKQHSDLNTLLYHQNKAAADLNALFASPSVAVAAATSTSNSSKSGSSTSNSTGTPSPLTDPTAYYNALAQEKMNDYTAFFQQQHNKFGIPDPLSKSTLAANNLFMSPSALLKIQQESLSAMMMKPPKSTTSTGANLNRNRESSASPALERLTPTKSAGIGLANITSGPKYNFSAVDLAISSVPSNTPSPVPSDGSNSSSHRRPTNTPPVDLSRLYGNELVSSSLGAGVAKKRMEFSSIADLAAPPPAKIPKTNDDILNLSHE